MKNLYLFFAFPIVVCLVGCSVGHAIQEISSQDFELGKEKTVFVGEAMISFVFGSTNLFNRDLLQAGTKEELVYSGKSGKTIKVDYRQYYGKDSEGWYIKDGFTQHLEYDLSTSPMIAYKNYRIKVIACNSSAIKFIVMEQ